MGLLKKLTNHISKVGVWIEVFLELLRYYIVRPRGKEFAPLLADVPGRKALNQSMERCYCHLAAFLERSHIRCLPASVALTRSLRRRGFAARIVLSVDVLAPAEAHSQVQIGDLFLSDAPPYRRVLK